MSWHLALCPSACIRRIHVALTINPWTSKRSSHLGLLLGIGVPCLVSVCPYRPKQTDGTGTARCW